MAALPTGTVTFLFTDIEGSTRLLQRLGDRYADVLATHHRLLRTVIEEARVYYPGENRNRNRTASRHPDSNNPH
jgi:class 3 adenylate cyclase